MYKTSDTIEDIECFQASFSRVFDDDSDNTSMLITGHPRQKINARERYRTFNVNAAYETLSNLIPTEPVNRKLSKIEIIRLAKSYITHLHSTLETGTDRQPCLLLRTKIKHGPNSIGEVERLRICTFCLSTHCIT